MHILNTGLQKRSQLQTRTENKTSYETVQLIQESTVRAKVIRVKGKPSPVTGRGGPYGCEMSRFPHFLDNRLTDGGKVCQPYAPKVIRVKFQNAQYTT
jgi:hypothetical protein